VDGPGRVGGVASLSGVDLICINQVDMKERGEQVCHMKKIFSAAEMVLVYVGEEAVISTRKSTK